MCLYGVVSGIKLYLFFNIYKLKTMRSLFVILTLLSSFFVKAQQHYFVSSSYHDQNGPSDGSEDRPWKTLDEAAVHAGENSVINLMRGDVFYGTLKIGANSIVVQDYGKSDIRPVISGFDEHTIIASEYESVENNIYRYPLATQPSVVVMEGVLLELGRTPNSDAENGGYISSFTVAGENAIIDNGHMYAPLTQEVVIRTRDWSIEKKRITSITNENIINFDNIDPLNGNRDGFRLYNEETGVAIVGFGYFFQNGPNTLDKDGEWYYDKENKQLYIYFSERPSTDAKIKASKYEKLIDIDTYSDITIKNIDLEGADIIGIDMNNNSKISISNCQFRYIGARGIRAIKTSEFMVSNCIFSDCISNAIQFSAPAPSQYTQNCTITKCSFTNIAPYIGMSYNADRADASAIQAYAKSFLTIANNDFSKIAKAAILFAVNGYSGGRIENNSITEAVLSYADFGALYSYYGPNDANPSPNDCIIISNVISNCPGNVYGTPTLPANVRANGIYIDGKSVGYSIIQNTIYNMAKSGITANDPNGIAFWGNTLVDNKNGILFTHRGKNKDFGVNVDVVENTFYSTNGQQVNIYFEDQILEGEGGGPVSLDQLIEKVRSFGWFDVNYYGLTNPIPFCVDVSKTVQKFNFGFNAWKIVRRDEERSKALPQRLNWAPGGSSYTLSWEGESLFAGGDDPYLNSFGRTASPTTYPIHYSREMDGVNGTPCMRIHFPTPWPNKFATITRGSLTLPEGWYVLRYETKGTSEFGITNAFFRDYANNLLAPMYTATFNADLKKHEFLFYLPATEGFKRLFIQIDGNSSDTYIDDIQLYEASGEFTSNNKFVSFIPNPSGQSIPFQLPTTCIDKYETIFNTSETIEVPPYDNRLLFVYGLVNNRPMHNLQTPPNKTAETPAITFYPNPVNGILRIEDLRLTDKWEYVTIKAIDGKQAHVIQPVSGKESVSIDLDKLTPGVYVAILLRKNGKSFTYKFIKN